MLDAGVLSTVPTRGRVEHRPKCVVVHTYIVIAKYQYQHSTRYELHPPSGTNQRSDIFDDHDSRNRLHVALAKCCHSFVEELVRQCNADSKRR